MKTVSRAELFGKLLSDELFNQLILIFSSAGISLLDATAVVCGDNANNAYLWVELLIEGHEFTPYKLQFPLKGSSVYESVHKDYLRDESISLKLDSKIRSFFKKIVDVLEFKGCGLSIEESVRDDCVLPF